MPRILICGDCEGNLILLSKLQSALNTQKGPFDFCLCCGLFSSPLSDISLQKADLEKDCEFDSSKKNLELKSDKLVEAEVDDSKFSDQKTTQHLENISDKSASTTNLKEEKINCKEFEIESKILNLKNKNKNLSDLLKDELEFFNRDFDFCIPTYFVDTNSEKAEFLHNYYLQNNSSSSSSFCAPLELNKNLYFLGTHGIIELEGIIVAFLSGCSAKSENSRPPFYREEDINSLIKLFNQKIESEDKKVDILLTSEWPSEIEKNLNSDNYNTLNELLTSNNQNFNHFSSTEITHLAEIIKPKYHFSSLKQTFYQKPPIYFQNTSEPYKFISLGKLGLKGPQKKAFHALHLFPSQTPSTNKRKAESQLQPQFNTINNQNENSTPTDSEFTQTEVVYISNINYQTDENSLKKVLSTFGSLKFLRFPKDNNGLSIGKAWAVYTSHEFAVEASKASNFLEINKKKLKLCLWKGKIPNFSQKQTKTQFSSNLQNLSDLIVQTDPQTDCWFCLSNPNLVKHLLILMGKTIYISLPKGPLTNEHLLILPIKHYPSFFHTTQDIRIETQIYISKLRNIFYQKGKDVIVYERFFPSKSLKAMHTQIHIISIPINLSFYAYEAFLKEFKSHNINITRFYSHSDGIIDLPQALSNLQTTSYIYLDLPAENTASGKQPLKCIAIPNVCTQQMPLNLCRNVIAEILEINNRSDWRNVESSIEEETELAQKYQQLLKSTN